MPADIIGTTVIDEDAKGGKVFEFRKGPIFANIVLADEISRATPRRRARFRKRCKASCDGRQTTYKIEEPFFVLATQNPLKWKEPILSPKRSSIRFFFKLHVVFRRATGSIHLDRTTGGHDPVVEPVLRASR
jgi:MoxR-like ATPase